MRKYSKYFKQIIFISYYIFQVDKEEDKSLTYPDSD